MCTDWAPSVFVTYDLRVEEEWNVNAPVEQLDLACNNFGLNCSAQSGVDMCVGGAGLTLARVGQVHARGTCQGSFKVNLFLQVE